MPRSKPRILEAKGKNMRVKCPFCGWHCTVPKTKRALACNRCKRTMDLDTEYTVDKYY